MASAVLANRNEPDWTQPRGGAKFMGKIPFSNPNPKFSKKRKFHAAPVVDIDESPVVTQSVASDDASSINRRPSDVNSGGYVTFNVASYSKKELAQLKSRLLSELEQIRQLKTRIEANDFHIRSSSNVLPPKKSVNKNISGNKRPLPSSFVNDLKKSTSNPEIAPLMKGCGQILSKLMKTKHAYLFNKPVDVVGLGLHDYHDVIKHPMDLGTVKLKLGKNTYESPLDLAADVRLTFNNAMAYNPKGHDVHVIADQLLGRFEELFRPLNVKLGDEKRQERVNHEEFQSSSWNRSEPERVRKDEDDYFAQKPSSEIPMRNPASVSNPNPNSQSTMQMPVRTPSPMRSPPVKPVKQPKPKAKDPNKREMSMEEKHRLGLGLQSLPSEKMEQVVQIIRKRNGHLTQDGDEIELDIEAVDIETLWELDRFVTNYKKMVSKIKRQALMGINVPANEVHKVEVPGNKRIEVAAEAEKPKKGDAAGDEDVDIGDEMPMSSFPPVEIEKDNGHASSDSSSSSGSTSDSSSSSDSDSGSSSGSDSDDAQS